MKAAKEISKVISAFLLFAFVVSSGSMAWSPKGSLNFRSLALAAEESNEEEPEPFSTERQVVSDPLESMNRTFFKFNDKLYFWFLKPVAQVYGKVLPQGFRVDLRNAYHNILMPVRLVNTTLQGKFKGAGIELLRFGINSTIGVVGMIDVAAKDFNLDSQDEDFGQTMGFYGMKPIVYVVWPFLGPSSLRDTIGLGADTFLSPITYISPDIFTSAGIKAGTMVNSTSLRIGEYEDFKKSALDPYVSMRDIYLQNRASEIQH